MNKERVVIDNYCPNLIALHTYYPSSCEDVNNLPRGELDRFLHIYDSEIKRCDANQINICSLQN